MASRDRLDVAFVILIALAFAALTTAASNNEPFTGTLIVPDAHWSAAHGGTKYVLEEEDGGELYALEGQEGRLSALAGQKVTVIGTESDDEIHVSSVYVPKQSEPTAVSHMTSVAAKWSK